MLRQTMLRFLEAFDDMRAGMMQPCQRLDVTCHQAQPYSR
jgi:hypothetical protein